MKSCISAKSPYDTRIKAKFPKKPRQNSSNLQICYDYGAMRRFEMTLNEMPNLETSNVKIIRKCGDNIMKSLCLNQISRITPYVREI